MTFLLKRNLDHYSGKRTRVRASRLSPKRLTREIRITALEFRLPIRGTDWAPSDHEDAVCDVVEVDDFIDSGDTFTLKVPAPAMVEVSGTKIQCQEGSAINLSSWPATPQARPSNSGRQPRAQTNDTGCGCTDTSTL